MNTLMSSFGKSLTFIMTLPFFSAVLLFLSGIFLGEAIYTFFRTSRRKSGVKGVGVRLIIALVFLIIALVLSGTMYLVEGDSFFSAMISFLRSYWAIFIIGFGIGIVLGLLRKLALLGIFVVIAIFIFLSALFLWTFNAFTGKTPILEVTVVEVRSIPGEDNKEISLEIKDLQNDFVYQYTVVGTKWGVGANVVVFDDWVVLLGGKTYYQLSTVLGRSAINDDNKQTLDVRYFDEYSNEVWKELEHKEKDLVGVRAVYESDFFKYPVEGYTYTIYVENDADLIPELQ